MECRHAWSGSATLPFCSAKDQRNSSSKIVFHRERKMTIFLCWNMMISTTETGRRLRIFGTGRRHTKFDWTKTLIFKCCVCINYRRARSNQWITAGMLVCFFFFKKRRGRRFGIRSYLLWRKKPGPLTHTHTTRHARTHWAHATIHQRTRRGTFCFFLKNPVDSARQQHTSLMHLSTGTMNGWLAESWNQLVGYWSCSQSVVVTGQKIRKTMTPQSTWASDAGKAVNVRRWTSQSRHRLSARDVHTGRCTRRQIQIGAAGAPLVFVGKRKNRKCRSAGYTASFW